MASLPYVYDPNKEEEDKPAPAPLGTAAPITSNVAGEGAPATGSAQGTTKKRRTAAPNVQAFLAANVGQGKEMAGRIAGEIGKETSEANLALGSAGAGAPVWQAPRTYSDVISTDFLTSPNAQQNMTQLINYLYGGKGLAGAETQVEEAKKIANLAGSAGGLQEIASGVMPGKTSALDVQLMTSPTAGAELTDAIKRANETGKTLEGLQGRETSRENLLSGLEEQYQRWQDLLSGDVGQQSYTKGIWDRFGKLGTILGKEPTINAPTEFADVKAKNDLIELGKNAVLDRANYYKKRAQEEQYRKNLGNQVSQGWQDMGQWMAEKNKPKPQQKSTDEIMKPVDYTGYNPTSRIDPMAMYKDPKKVAEAYGTVPSKPVISRVMEGQTPKTMNTQQDSGLFGEFQKGLRKVSDWMFS